MRQYALAIEKSENSKIKGKDQSCSTTYAHKASCPASCPFRKSGGCYAAVAHTNIHWNRCGQGRPSPESIARSEAALIRGLTGQNDLRVHTAGDCRTNGAAKLVAAAAEEHMAKHGKRAWSYTHAWRTVARESWGKVSVLASCETAKEAKEAQALGYATCVVVPSFEKDYPYDWNGVRLVPCPKQTHKAASCVSCGLCMLDQRLHKAGLTVAFAAHGPVARCKSALEKAGRKG